MAACEECPICTTTDVILISPNDTKKEHPEFKTNCNHRLCRTCWVKISHCDEIACPYCRENITEWLQTYLNVVIMKNDGNNSYSEKEKYASYLACGNFIVHLILHDCETSTSEIFFFEPEVLAVGTNEHNIARVYKSDDIKDALIGDRRKRELCKHQYVINEYIRFFNHEKMRQMALYLGEENGSHFKCCCNTKMHIAELDQHLDTRWHKEFMKFMVDRNFERYTKIFHHINIDAFTVHCSI